MLEVVIIVLGVALTCALLVLWSLIRHKSIGWTGFESSESIERVPELLAGLTLGSVAEGNSVELLHNASMFERLQADCMAASHSIHFETFLWKSGALSGQLVTTLASRARDGLQVRMTLDGEGAKNMSQEERQTLRDAGVQLAFYHPRRIWHIGTYNVRDHRKLVVLDGTIGYVGGHCVADGWLGEPEKQEDCRDISVRVRGPVVRQFQAAFSENWTEVTGNILFDHKLFPQLEREGESKAHLVYIDLARRVSAVRTLYMAAFALAQHEVLVQNPYFLPDDESIAMLQSAVQRGVKIRVMMPTLGSSDDKLVQHAARHRLGEVLHAGVEVLGYHRALLHQKTLVVDKQWCVVGSTNFDPRSFDINEEVSLAIHNPDLAEELAEAFEADTVDCHPETLERWNGRSILERATDRLAWSFHKML